MYKKLKRNLLGLNFSKISAENIKTEGEYHQYDILKNKQGTLLLFNGESFELVTTDAFHYVTKKDLRGTFKRYE